MSILSISRLCPEKPSPILHLVIGQVQVCPHRTFHRDFIHILMSVCLYKFRDTSSFEYCWMIMVACDLTVMSSATAMETDTANGAEHWTVTPSWMRLSLKLVIGWVYPGTQRQYWGLIQRQSAMKSGSSSLHNNTLIGLAFHSTCTPCRFVATH